LFDSFRPLVFTYHLSRRSMSFKVTDFCTNRNSECDFLVHPTSHLFPVIAQYWSNCRLCQVGASR